MLNASEEAKRQLETDLARMREELSTACAAFNERWKGHLKDFPPKAQARIAHQDLQLARAWADIATRDAKIAGLKAEVAYHEWRLIQQWADGCEEQGEA